VYAPEVEVAFGWYIGNIGRDFALLAQLVDGRRRCGVVYRNEHHLGAVQVVGLEDTVGVGDLPLIAAVFDFFVEAGGRAYDVDFGIGVETVEDSACGYLD
jgi:hypothetical protein